ncbi:glycerophosphodiester phosphodiesterase [Paenibacillus glycanilyticus]|uniref:Glycerophosphoryl diester phosphodiesterase n=1 Tax=Paenibacillus glycanilyticus TaxID=126569 RepID=A0ABQ6GM73_9BACL|nr:glycerophosphodiester phosphodiesterase family protein [Paenibacillus glycanilyticus]GLX70436.1 glycerophosphoryl diester phosphodiesterase [Paenibacillus glycanilyticus]
MTNLFPLITAHSGCMNTPDNSLLSVQTGLLLGADIIEEDVLVTKDGIPVLAHDDKRTMPSGREFTISELSYEEIAELQLQADRDEQGDTPRLCRLEEMLPLIKASGKMANLDLKADDCIEAVAKFASKHGVLEHVFLSGCETERALKAQSYPELKKLLNAKSDLFVTMKYEAAVVQTCKDALEASCFGININYKFVRPELVEYASSKGLPVYVWTVNEEALMEDFIGMGIASITTRNVEELVRLKRRMLEVE